MSAPTVLRLRKPAVVADLIDGEVIAIDLDSGAYFSFRESASLIVRLLFGGGATRERVLAEIARVYGVEAAQVGPSAVAFLEALERERLVVAAPGDGVPEPLLPEGDGARGRDVFDVPVYEKYTDMEKFLLVDPIHEVDVSEWPRVEERSSE